MKTTANKPTKTIAHIDNGRTVVTHPDAPKGSVTISANGDRFHCFAQVDGVAMSAFCGKSYASLATARKAADKWLCERAERVAADKAHAAAHPYTPPSPEDRPAWMIEADQIAEDGYVIVHKVVNGVTVGVERGARIF